jgi:hypothetical protein
MGYGFGADAKYYFGDKRNLGIAFSLGFHTFSVNEENVTINEPGGTIGVTDAYVTGDFTRRFNSVKLGLGLEYAFSPKSKVNPFIAAEFTGHYFNGYFEYFTEFSSNKTYYESASRYGLAGGIGADITLKNNLGIIIGGRYDLANLIGKDSLGYFNLKYGINDKEHINSVGNKVKSRNISYLHFYAGVSFYFNEPKRMKK